MIMLVMVLPTTQIVKAESKPMIRDMDTGYLLNCSFRAIRPYAWTGKTFLTGWETDDRGGLWESSPYGLWPDSFSFDVDWFRLRDTSRDHAVTIKHQIARQTSGEVTLEFRFKLSTRMDGATWQLRDLKRPGLSIVTSGENLCYQTSNGNKVLITYELNREYGVKAVADLKKRHVNIYIDGELRGSNVPFFKPVKTIDYVLVKTGDEARGDLYLCPINVFKGYNLCETFVTSRVGHLPDNWTADRHGKSSIEAVLFTGKPDIYTLKLDGGAASQQFAPVGNKTVFEFRFMTPVRTDTVTELRNNSAPVLSFVTYNNDLCIVDNNNKNVRLVKNYVPNLWYAVKLIVDSAQGKAEVYVNGKLVSKNAPCRMRVPKVNGVRFAVKDSGRIMWVDDIKVYPWRDYPADYVPEPKPVKKKAGDYLVGVQSCNLYKEGDSWAGWEYMYPYAAKRKPYLGWYDEGNPEVSDWEIKWQEEHGIDFEQHCWYRSDSSINHPIKNGLCEHGIREGLFNARYSRLKKFTIMYTSEVAGGTNPDDWQRHIIPYWIEYFFKDPRYLKIEGKPVLSIYYLPSLLSDFGGTKGAAQALAVLRKACQDAGFPGIVILCENRGANPATMKQMKAVGFDYCYAYTWGTGNTQVQRKKMEAQRDAAAKAGFAVVPSFSNGWEATPVGGSGDGWASVDDYKTLAQWTKDTYMPGLPADSIGRKMILLSNWNEQSEGHFIMPSNLAGFGYLDALREVFTDGGPHKDIVPTAKQKRRFTLLYPKD